MTIVKSHEKKRQNNFPMTMIITMYLVKCRQNLNFEKMVTAVYTRKNDGF